MSRMQYHEVCDELAQELPQPWPAPPPSAPKPSKVPLGATPHGWTPPPPKREPTVNLTTTEHVNRWSAYSPDGERVGDLYRGQMEAARALLGGRG